MNAFEKKHRRFISKLFSLFEYYLYHHTCMNKRACNHYKIEKKQLNMIKKTTVIKYT